MLPKTSTKGNFLILYSRAPHKKIDRTGPSVYPDVAAEFFEGQEARSCLLQLPGQHLESSDHPQADWGPIHHHPGLSHGACNKAGIPEMWGECLGFVEVVSRSKKLLRPKFATPHHSSSLLTSWNEGSGLSFCEKRFPLSLSVYKISYFLRFESGFPNKSKKKVGRWFHPTKWLLFQKCVWGMQRKFFCLDRNSFSHVITGVHLVGSIEYTIYGLHLFFKNWWIWSPVFLLVKLSFPC